MGKNSYIEINNVDKYEEDKNMETLKTNNTPDTRKISNEKRDRLYEYLTNKNKKIYEELAK